MEKVILNKVIRNDKEGTEIEFIVRGHRVIGSFPATSKSGIYQHIKQILIDSYIANNFPINTGSF